MADVAIVITADNRGALTGMKQVGTAAEDIEKKSMKAGSALGDIAKIAGGFVVAQGLMKLPGLLSGFVGGASDLSESMSKVNVVFGANAKEIESWANGAAKNLGMSKGAALEATGTFGNFLQAMGATLPTATAMSKSMVQLATDLGSFNNANPEEVILALRSGLSGEAEPMKKFGVALTAVAVEAKGAQLGLGKLGKEMTEQEKIQARYAIIMEQTATAQGDFERTSSGLANQTKILKASFKDASDQLGTALLPAVVAVMGALIQLLPYAISVGQAIGGKFLDAIKSVGSSIGTFIDNVKWLLDNGGGLMDIVAGDNEPTFWQHLAVFVAQAVPLLQQLAVMAWDGFLAAVAAMKALAAMAWDGLVTGVTALKELAQTRIDHLAPQFEALKSAIQGISMADLNREFEDLKQKIKPAVDALSPLVDRILVALKQQFDDLKEALKPLGPALTDLGEALKPLAPVLGVVIVVAIGALLLAFEGLVRYFGGALTFGIEALVLVIQGITLAVDFVTKVVQEWGPKIGSAMGDVGKTFKANIDFIIGYFTPLMNIGEGVIRGIVDGIRAGTGAVMDAARGMVSAIEGAIPDWIPHSPSVAGVKIGQGFADGFTAGLEQGFPGITGMMEKWSDAVIKHGDVLNDWLSHLPGEVSRYVEAAVKFGDPLNDWLRYIPEAARAAAKAFGDMAVSINNDAKAANLAMGGGPLRNRDGFVIPGLDEGPQGPSSYVLGSDGKWHANEAAMPKGVTGASTTSNGNIASYIGGGQSRALNTAPNVGDTFNGMTWTGSYWSQAGATMQGPGAQHATITIVQNIGSVGSKGEAAMLMQDGAYALATRGL